MARTKHTARRSTPKVASADAKSRAQSSQKIDKRSPTMDVTTKKEPSPDKQGMKRANTVDEDSIEPKRVTKKLRLTRTSYPTVELHSTITQHLDAISRAIDDTFHGQYPRFYEQGKYDARIAASTILTDFIASAIDDLNANSSDDEDFYDSPRNDIAPPIYRPSAPYITNYNPASPQHSPLTPPIIENPGKPQEIPASPQYSPATPPVHEEPGSPMYSPSSPPY